MQLFDHVRKIGLSLILFSAGGLEGAQYSKSGKVCLEHLSNGLTYCISQEEKTSEHVAIKLMVKFGMEWGSEKERAVAGVLEKLLVQSFEEGYSLHQDRVEQYFSEIKLLQPQLYAVPNVILYRLDVAPSTQETLDFTFAFIRETLESFSYMDLKTIESKLEKVLYDQRAQPASVLFKDTFFHKVNFLEERDSFSSHITAEEIKEFYDRHYRPEKMVLFICGDVAHHVVMESVKTHFASDDFIKQERAREFASASEYKLSPVHRTKSSSNPVEWKIAAPMVKGGNAELLFQELPLLKKEEKTIQKIMHALATYNIPKLVWKQRELEKMGKSIDHVHPLKFIGYIIQEPILRSDLQEVHRNYFKWKAFLDGFRRRMTEEFYKGNLKSYVSGFCEELHIKEEVVEHFIERRDWEGLVKAILY